MSTDNSSVYFAHPLLRARDWQDRPQLGEVCRWWAEGGTGVCALVGIGGAGKTAIADRFLQLLPNVLPPRADLPKRADLRPPERLFVFSFYDAPNPDSFFASHSISSPIPLARDTMPAELDAVDSGPLSFR